MALRSVNLAIIDACNFRCAMCQIWQHERRHGLSAEAIGAAFRHERSELEDVEELSITGGEVFLRDDVEDIVDAVLPHLPALKRLFINTNSSFGDRAMRFAEHFGTRVPALFFCISIDGPKRVHDRLRGAQSYTHCIDLIEQLTALGIPELKVVISTTLVDTRSAITALRHVHTLKLQYGCELTFRPASSSDVYYDNGRFSAKLSPKVKEDIRSFIANHYSDDRFLQVMSEVLQGNCNTVMLDEKEELRCCAGDWFAFVQADGKIRPCIYSHRVLGSLRDGLAGTVVDDLGAHEPCPCCTECTIYPMIAGLSQQ